MLLTCSTGFRKPVLGDFGIPKPITVSPFCQQHGAKIFLFLEDEVVEWL